ncbi:MAG TPA: sulfotransferase domain-containing protein [Rhizomicrobium sp.]|nr:sulfotransferase domain-containing protein [Rhizomicrobium sp.]
MIIWLASYPRSGNTLLRILLKRCFGLDSYSIYSDEEFALPSVREVVGEKPIGADPQRFLQQMLQEKRPVCVKTHELPAPDSHRTIYVVRDGRAALVSHHHYLRDFWDAHTPLDELIKGLESPSWSRHVNAWLLSGRPNVLAVRYEDLVRADKRALDAIAGFLDRTPICAFDVSFAGLQEMMPAFFRAGSNESNIAEMTSRQLDLFECLHGSTLDLLGYPRMANTALLDG